MASNPIKPVRCAVYTRKSTEHGLELEFNSLDAQREACEAYIKSQASQGWRALPQRYDDPAYSGGNLDRPALQQLLKDVDAGKIDVIVVYKIDRLTRSLADFAKLVVAFDAKSISFVAVTQQFNTTSSMGRLTLNVLLSFAQFERELSSERVRDKIAASRRKGKWTGGAVPLGYRIEHKKLILDETEAQTVRVIFRRYLDLKSLTKLIADLDAQKIVTKRRITKIAKYNGGIPFAYGSLAHFLKNRTYVGETRHKDKWFPGEHHAIVEPQLFQAVQELLASNSINRSARRTASEAILMGKLYDDRGNRMSPSYSVKNGIRYRFYVSSALLRGRKSEVGSVGRVAAQEIEDAVLGAVIARRSRGPTKIESDAFQAVTRVTIHADHFVIAVSDIDPDSDGESESAFRVPWLKSATGGEARLVGTTNDPTVPADPALVQSLVRSHVWLRALQDGTHESVEALAEAHRLHPKVIRLALRLAFLSPETTAAILTGNVAAKAITLNDIPKSLSLSWAGQRSVPG